MIHFFISLFIFANVKLLKVRCHCHKYCDIMLHHCRSLSFGLTRWHSWRSCPSRRPVSKVGLESWENQSSTFSTWLIGLNQYFFKPYYSCSSTLTGTTENLIVVCTSPPCHSRWGPTQPRLCNVSLIKLSIPGYAIATWGLVALLLVAGKDFFSINIIVIIMTPPSL